LKSTLLIVDILIAIVFLLNCTDNIISECQVCSEDSLPGNMTFTDIQQAIFNNNCVACHSGSQPSGGLVLSEGVAYRNLVNKQSNGSGLKRVEPFNSSESYLRHVLEGKDAPLMPPGAQLDQAKIDSVKSWIDRGAAND
jgi:hypothetical protein